MGPVRYMKSTRHADDVLSTKATVFIDKDVAEDFYEGHWDEFGQFLEQQVEKLHAEIREWLGLPPGEGPA